MQLLIDPINTTMEEESVKSTKPLSPSEYQRRWRLKRQQKRLSGTESEKQAILDSCETAKKKRKQRERKTINKKERVMKPLIRSPQPPVARVTTRASSRAPPSKHTINKLLKDREYSINGEANDFFNGITKNREILQR